MAREEKDKIDKIDKNKRNRNKCENNIVFMKHNKNCFALLFVVVILSVAALNFLVTVLIRTYGNDIVNDDDESGGGSCFVSITFDDGWKCAYENAIPLLKEYGVSSTWYAIARDGDGGGDGDGDVNSNSNSNMELYETILKNSGIDKSPKAQIGKGLISFEEMRNLVYKYGHEIGSHGVTHRKLTLMTNMSDVEYELKQSQTIIQRSTNVIKIEDFASPFGSVNEEILRLIPKYYLSHRLSKSHEASPIDSFINVYDVYDDDDGNSKFKFDSMRIKARGVKRSTTVNDISKWIDYCIQSSLHTSTSKKNTISWLVLIYHDINDIDEWDFTTTTSEFRSHLDLLHHKSVIIKPLQQTRNAILNSLYHNNNN